jgi:6-pyruvoyltetrahydropterin/6-carboxytetrahydropterin synthase
MFEVVVGDSFAAAHNLRNYKGKCEALHGHNYKVWIKVSRNDIPSDGLVVDFKDLEQILKDTISELDHTYLNNLTFFKKHNPTSEMISKYIFDKISEHLRKTYPHLVLKEVQVWETNKACAICKE